DAGGYGPRGDGRRPDLGRPAGGALRDGRLWHGAHLRPDPRREESGEAPPADPRRGRGGRQEADPTRREPDQRRGGGRGVIRHPPRAATQGRPYENIPRTVSLFSRQVGREAG